MKIRSKLKKGLIGLVLASPLTFVNFSGNQRLDRPKINDSTERWQNYYNSIDEKFTSEYEKLFIKALSSNQTRPYLNGRPDKLSKILNIKNPSDKDFIFMYNYGRQLNEESEEFSLEKAIDIFEYLTDATLTSVNENILHRTKYSLHKELHKSLRQHLLQNK